MLPIRDNVPHSHLPVVTWLLISANLAVFGMELRLDPEHLHDLFALCGLVPARYGEPLFAARHQLPAHDLWPFVTSMFLHAGWLHLGANLWMLFLFGDNVEDRLGPLSFLGLYLACGVLAGVLHVAINPGSSLPTVGASGAIAGVMGAYFVAFPRARIVVLFPLFFWPLFFELPAVVFLGIWLLLQLQGGALALGCQAGSGGVAWWAHVGGFLTGAALLLLLPRPSGTPALAAANLDPR